MSSNHQFTMLKHMKPKKKEGLVNPFDRALNPFDRVTISYGPLDLFQDMLTFPSLLVNTTYKVKEQQGVKEEVCYVIPYQHERDCRGFS